MEPGSPNLDLYLPQELQMESLLRLPVKSLIRFISVSKPWQSLIKVSTFIRKRINQSHENAASEQHLLLRCFLLDKPEPTLRMLNDNENFGQDYVDLEIPPPLLPEQKKMDVKPYVSDGEILLLDCFDGFNLWNPSINKTIWVPNLPPWLIFKHAFGYDTRTNDYKVLRIGCPGPQRTYETPIKAQIFSLREGYWRDIVGESPQHPVGSDPIYLNRSMYWIMFFCDEEGKKWILSFDFGAEVFGKIALPEQLAYCDSQLEPVVFEESISLFQNDYDDMNNTCSLWVMKETNVWTKMWSYGPANFRPLGFRLNDELLMEVEEGDKGELFSLNLKTQNRRSLGIEGNEFLVDTYVKSLALIDY